MTSEIRKLVDLRKGRFPSQGHAAIAVAVSSATLSRWEAGQAEPHPRYRKAYAAALGITLAELGAVIYDPASAPCPATQDSTAGVEG